MRWAWCLLLFWTNLVAAESLKIAVASNFKGPLQTVIKEFEQHYNTQVLVSSASSGVLFQQIIHGAPFDVFLSADEYRPAKLIEQGYAVAASKQVYAIGELVFYSPTQGITLAQLAQQRDITIAVANSKHAPYGIATKAYLDKFIGPLQGKQITTNNIAQTFQVVHSGNAKAGFVALSHVIAQGVPEANYQRLATTEANISQYAVVLANSKNQEKAQQLLTYLRSEPVRLHLASLGYQ